MASLFFRFRLQIRLCSQAASRSGSSLVEVILALGVIAVVITPLIGLLAHGSEFMRSAEDRTVAAAIVEQIQAELQQNSFQKVGNKNEDEFYFTQQGQMTSQSAADRLYQATVTVSQPVSLPGSVSASPNLVKMEVKVARHPPGASEDAVEQNTRHYFIYLSNKNQF